jgi:hypothetical protein
MSSDEDESIGKDAQMEMRMREMSLRDPTKISPRKKSTRVLKRVDKRYYVKGAPIPIGDFQDSCSEFGQFEEGALRVEHHYHKISDIRALFSELDFATDLSADSAVKSALLPGITFENISTAAAKALCSNDDMHRLRRKYEEVFANNYMISTERDEGAIDAFISPLLVLLRFDSEPLDLRAQPLLYLAIGRYEFACITDFAARLDKKIYVAVVENKHIDSSTYKHGRLQLTCAMISAAQQRATESDDASFLIYGLLVVADQFSFAKTTITRDYLNALAVNKTPNNNLEVHWVPEETTSKYPNRAVARTMFGLKYGVEEDRKVIVTLLSLLAAKVTPVDAVV